MERCYLFDTGIQSMIHTMCRRRTMVTPQIFCMEKETEAPFAFHHTEGAGDNCIAAERAFANCILTPEGGTHLTGFRTALTRAFNDYATKSSVFNDPGHSFAGEDVRSELIAVISVKLSDQQFKGQTKNKLSNPDMGATIATAVDQEIRRWLEQEPDAARAIMQTRTPWNPAHCPASWPTAKNGTPRSVNSASSRAIPPAAQPNRDATAASRQSCPCGARPST